MYFNWILISIAPFELICSYDGIIVNLFMTDTLSTPTRSLVAPFLIAFAKGLVFHVFSPLRCCGIPNTPEILRFPSTIPQVFGTFAYVPPSPGLGNIYSL